MANVGVDCSSAGQQTTVVNESYFSWIMRLFTLIFGRCLEEMNIGSMVDTTRTEERTEKEPTFGRTKGWMKKMTKRRTEKINVGTEEIAEELPCRRKLAAESGDGRPYCPFGSEIKAATRDRKSLRYIRDGIDSLSDVRLLSARLSRAPDMNLIKPAKENNMLLAEELSTLRNDFNAMKRKINTIENSFSMMELAHNIKHNQLVGVVLKSSVNENSNLDTMNEKINNLSNKFERTVNTLLSEKELLIKVNRNIVGEMKNLKMKLASVKRKHNGHKNCAKKSDFDLLLVEIKNLKNQINNSKKDLDGVKDISNESSSTRKNVDTEKIENTRKYDKLKMRLCMVENAVSACTRERANEPITNNHYYGPQQCTHCPMPPVATAAPPVAYSVPPPPPPPPEARPAPSVPISKPSASKVAEPCKSGQYLSPPMYTITADLLLDMTKQLRTPDKDNIRKIPRRADILIPSTATNTADQKVPLPPPAPNDVEAPEPLTS